MMKAISNDPKKHHFSPAFYLSGWCGTNEQLVEYCRPYRQVVAKRRYPTAAGFKPFLYTLEGVIEEQKQIIEKNYMSPIVDNRAAIALQVLINHDPSSLTEEARCDWTRFLMAGLVRNPKALAESLTEFKSILKENLSNDAEVYASERREGDPSTLYEWVMKNHAAEVNDIGKKLLVSSIENESMGSIIINMQWSVLDLSISLHELLTSDAPHLRFYGLKDNRCLIAFPLTSKLLFVATHDRKAEFSLLALGNTTIVIFINDNIVRIADRYVYATHDRHLPFIEKRLRIPSQSDLDR